ncbi:hypothetical protein DFJ58DRAFT_670936, partial [Suillus subalutaceus]|uniref:uncharacterized protein n=1 Tax=Suillus subalutaceus TaxID=48586 RepID=UPI001B87805D
VAEDQQHTRKKSFVDFKNAVWHKSFYRLLHSIKLHSKTGHWFECEAYDNVMYSVSSAHKFTSVPSANMMVSAIYKEIHT